MRVTQIWRFPVKSMGGESLESAMVGDVGVEHDRAWSIFDVETGTTLTARRTPELLFASAQVHEGELAITLPDGSQVGSDDHAAVCAWLGRDVEIRAAGGHDEEVGGTYEVPLDFENDADWVSWQGPGGAFHDSTRTRVSLVSEATLGDWDRKRFRTNLIVDVGGEDGLVGTRIAVGGAHLDVVKQVDRCVMVSRPQPGLEGDLDVLRAINSERDSMLAIGCLVASPGDVTVGDEVRPVG